MSDYTLAIVIIVVVLLFIIGNYSTVHKTASKPIRKKSLNDLEETLPRSNKKQHVLPTVNKKQ